MSGRQQFTTQRRPGMPDRVVRTPLDDESIAGYVAEYAAREWPTQPPRDMQDTGPGTETEDETYDNVLDPYDPFEAVLVTMVAVNRKKRRDYAVDGSPWSNFEFTAVGLGIEPVDAAIHNVLQKLARLSALRANGRTQDPTNEAVSDTYLDLAVYAAIALGIYTYPGGRVPGSPPQPW